MGMHLLLEQLKFLFLLMGVQGHEFPLHVCLAEPAFWKTG